MSSSLQTLIRDLHRRRGRERRGLALAEGVRLVEEALATAITVRGAAVSPALEATTRGKALKAALLATRQIRVEEVSEQELDALTDTEHPQGIVAVVEPKEWTLADIRLTPGVTALVLDAVQDPGNVGTMLRTALGLGGAGVDRAQGHRRSHQPEGHPRGHGRELPPCRRSPQPPKSWWHGPGSSGRRSGLPTSAAKSPARLPRRSASGLRSCWSSATKARAWAPSWTRRPTGGSASAWLRGRVAQCGGCRRHPPA